MKQSCSFCLLPLLVVLLWGSLTWAAEQPPAPVAASAPVAPPAPVTGQQGIVLGQPDAQRNSASAQPAAVTAPPAQPVVPSATVAPTSAPPQAEAKKPDVQSLFEESLRQMMPLDNSQIQQYREWSDQRDRALVPVSPALVSRTARVSLEPGSAPVRVFTTANIATSLLIHDSTGQPWPITSVTNGGPSFFQVLRPELPDGNLLNVMPTQGYGTTTLVVTLEKQDIPLVIRLESDSVRGPERKADALVLFQISQQGPRAKAPLIQDIKETVDSTMLAFLDHVPPSGALRVRMEPKADKVIVWKLGAHHYIRTNHTLMWPAWTAVVHGAGNMKCYEVPITSRVMVSVEGRMQTLVLSDASSLAKPQGNSEVKP